MISARQNPGDLVADVERRLEEIEALADPIAREVATGLVAALLELYGEGLGRIVEAAATSVAAGELAEAFAADELISHLLVLHGLHPLALEERIAAALDDVRPYLQSHGGSVELAGVDGGVVRVRMSGSCHGCPSSAVTLRLAIENAIRQRAPEVEEVVAEEPSPPAGAPLLQIELTPSVEGEWVAVSGLGAAPVLREVGGAEVLFLHAAGRRYAYGARCPACERSLEDAGAVGAELTCGGCGARYDVLRAGRGVDRPDLHLDPVPLLESVDGTVRVALPTVA